MSTNFFLNIKKLSDNAIIPTFGNADDAGIDLHTTIDHTFRPGTWAPIPTGLLFEFARGHIGWIVPNTNLAHQQGLTILNAPSQIQAEDRGEILVLLVNRSDHELSVEVGQKIAQIVFMPIVPTLDIQSNTKIVTELTDQDRREGAFGSSSLTQSIAENVDMAVGKFMSELASIDNYVNPEWELELKQEIWDRFAIHTLSMQSMFNAELAKIRTPRPWKTAR